MTKLDNSLQNINNSILMALSGRLPEMISSDEQSQSEDMQNLTNNLNKLFVEYNEACEFLKNISIGNLDINMGRSGFLIKSYLKTFQMMLNHLNWKTKKIAEGDFTQRIDFLGDFSNSYNYMVEMLDQSIKKINEQSQQIKKYQEQKLNVIIDNMQGGIIIFDENGIINFCNYYVENIFACTSKEILNNKIGLFIPKLNIDNKELNDLISSNAVHFETTLTHDNVVTLFIDVKINKALINEKESYIMIMHDITELKKMQKIKTEFVSTVSHELRTPLTAINGSIELMKSGAFGNIPEKALELINIVDRNGKRLLNLINDILDVEKLGFDKFNLQFEEHDLVTLINEAIQLNSNYLNEAEVSINFVSEIDKLIISLDKSRIIQVLTNLISNAIKFSPKGSTVQICTEKSNDYVKILVIDKGIGIAPEEHAKLFQKFTQLDSSDTRKKGGTGLGLYICKAIIQKHNGKIGFDSKLNEGTTFYFELPFSSPSQI